MPNFNFCRRIKAYDIAADEANGEPPDFSDDEEEQAYYEQLRRQQKKKQEKNCTKNSGGNTRQLTKQMFIPGECPSFYFPFLIMKQLNNYLPK